MRTGQIANTDTGGFPYAKLYTVVTEARRYYTDIGFAGHYMWGDWGKYIPFLGLDVGDAQGMYVGVEWSVGCIYQNDVSVNTTVVEANGYENGDDFSSVVPVGGTFVVPPAFVGAYTGDLDDAGNDLKKYLWNYSMPEILRKDETYPKVQWNGFAALGDKKDSWTTLQSRWNPWIDAIAPLGFEEATVNGKADYYTTANWANSPPMAKFVDTLPLLGVANNLGQMLPVAVPDTTTYPGSDY